MVITMPENKKVADLFSIYGAQEFKEKILSSFAESELARWDSDMAEPEQLASVSERIRVKSEALARIIDLLPTLYRDSATLKERVYTYNRTLYPFSCYRLQSAFIIATRAFGTFDEIAATLLLPFFKDKTRIFCKPKRVNTEEMTRDERERETESARDLRLKQNAACDLLERRELRALSAMIPGVSYNGSCSFESFCEQLDESILALAQERLYRQLMAHVERDLGGENAFFVQTAYEKVLELHGDRRRHSGEPYIFHALAVALQLTDYKVSAEALAAALLHDTVEQTKYELKDVARDFTESIRAYVGSATHIATLKSDVNISRTEIVALAANAKLDERDVDRLERDIKENPDLIAGLYIKAADRLVNMRTLDALDPIEKHNKVAQTVNYYLPLFRRFRLGDLSYAIESEILALEKPKPYKRIRKEYNELLRKNAFQYACLEQNLRRFLQPLLEKEGFTPSYRSSHYTPAEIVKQLEEYEAQSTFTKKAYLARCAALRAEPNGETPITKKTVKLKKLYLILHAAKPEASIADLVKLLLHEHAASLAGGSYASTAERDQSYLLEDYSYDERYGQYRLVFADRFENRVELFIMTYHDYMYARFGESFSGESFLLNESRLITASLNGSVFSFSQGATVLDLAFLRDERMALSLTGAKINGEEVALSRKLRDGDNVTLLFAREDASKVRPITAALDWFAYAETLKSRTALIEHFKRVFCGDSVGNETALNNNVFLEEARALYDSTDALQRIDD